VIAAVATAAGAAHSWIVPVKLRAAALIDVPTNIAPDPDPPAQGPLDPATLGPRISLDQAHALFEEGGYLFIDTRPKEYFDAGHILGAFHLSTKEFGEPEGTEVISMLRPEDHFVLYCDGGECDASENVAARLESVGIAHFHIMTASFEEWKKAGYDIEPVEEGAP
jgi:rhodanese-related sulfurtransferase